MDTEDLFYLVFFAVLTVIVVGLLFFAFSEVDEYEKQIAKCESMGGVVIMNKHRPQVCVKPEMLILDGLKIED